MTAKVINVSKAIPGEDKLNKISLEIESSERISFLQGVRKPPMVNLPAFDPDTLSDLSGGPDTVFRPVSPRVVKYGLFFDVAKGTPSNRETAKNQANIPTSII